MKTAFICPGQASQVVGMGKDLYDTFPEARARFQQADELMQEPLSRICFEGPEDKLKQTQFTQPALFVHSAIIADLLAKRGVKPDMTAGHSLGEYSALYAAGALSFESALRVVIIRGRGMQKAGEMNPGSMAAVMGLEEDRIRQICEEASSAGVVQPANFNSPGQVVISGSAAGVRRAMEISKSAGAKLVKELVVSGAFHSPLMEPARESLFEALDRLEIARPFCPVYSNVSATPTVDPEQVRIRLKEQLLAPVLWYQSVEAMIRDGAERFLEIGPGQVLIGLLKRIRRESVGIPVGTAAELNALQ